ncbi:MAG TPA: hypothetical protein VGX25_11440 [Actinophytocola sp.]|nr:hypothetical protein [Actinophytocola sp.]HEV2779998.1 hypothetical protein [Actinophytocola sp.]
MDATGRRWGRRVARAAMAVAAAGIAVLTVLSNEMAGPGAPVEPGSPVRR